MKYILLSFLFLFGSKSLIDAQTNATTKTESNPELFLCFYDQSCKCSIPKTCSCLDSCFVIKNKFDYVFAKNCRFRSSKNGRAITPKYLTVYDRRDETVTYLKLKNDRGYEYFKIKKHIQPKANFEMHVTVIARDTGYHLKTSNEDFFMEYEASFAQSIQKAGSSNDTSRTVAESNDTAESGSTENNFGAQELKTDQKLQSLHHALKILNARYPEQSIIGENYHQDLVCLRLRIREHFGFSIPIADSLTLQHLDKESQSLFDSLITRVDVSEILNSIRSQYYLFIKKQITLYRVHSKQIQIPDKDGMKLTLEQKIKNNTTEILKRDLRISGGFKIDFSAGIFLTGLSVPDFVVRPYSFKYRETSLTVDTSTGTVTTSFTGNVKDTTGNLIQIKDPKSNYAAGFMSHAYVRTGTFANIGISTGLLVNDNGFQMLVGSSLLLNIRNSRIALSAGVSIGKQKKISPVATNSLWTESLRNPGVLDDLSQVPEFTNVADVPFFNQWRTSWYFGLTYNFRSTVLRF